MTSSFAGKVAVVTGAGGGLGRVHALNDLSAEGVAAHFAGIVDRAGERMPATGAEQAIGAAAKAGA